MQERSFCYEKNKMGSAYNSAFDTACHRNGIRCSFTGGRNVWRYDKAGRISPAWLFPVVWTVLFALMGISSFLIYNSDASEKSKMSALTVYAVQLAVNFMWPIFFFRMGAYLFSFIWLILLWALVLIMILKFYKINRTAAFLQLPYILWLTFAGYLNLSVYLLNR